MASSELPAYSTKAEAADRFRVSVRTVERWIKAGVLGALRAPGGGRVLIPRAEILTFEHRLERDELARRDGLLKMEELAGEGGLNGDPDGK